MVQKVAIGTWGERVADVYFYLEYEVFKGSGRTCAESTIRRFGLTTQKLAFEILKPRFRIS